MAMTCKTGARECDGCMACQESNDPVLYDWENEPIYPGETYYDILGEIVREDGIYDYCDQFKREAR